jgi:hypothetical protein
VQRDGEDASAPGRSRTLNVPPSASIAVPRDGKTEPEAGLVVAALLEGREHGRGAYLPEATALILDLDQTTSPKA